MRSERRHDALLAVQEGTDIYRKLAGRSANYLMPNLANGLNSLGNRLSALGRREEALQAADEAVQIHRTLARDEPDAFAPDLAMSLNNHGNRGLASLGQHDDALVARQGGDRHLQGSR